MKPLKDISINVWQAWVEILELVLYSKYAKGWIKKYIQSRLRTFF